MWDSEWGGVAKWAKVDVVYRQHSTQSSGCGRGLMLPSSPHSGMWAHTRISSPGREEGGGGREGGREKGREGGGREGGREGGGREKGREEGGTEKGREGGRREGGGREGGREKGREEGRKMKYWLGVIAVLHLCNCEPGSFIMNIIIYYNYIT